MARRFNRRPLTEAERDARRSADRDRIEQAARALLTTEGWQRWINVRASNGLSRYSLRKPDDPDRDRVPPARDHADLRRRLPRLPAAQPRACARARGIRILAPVTVKDRDEHGEETGGKRIFFSTVPSSTSAMTDPLPGTEPVPLAPPAEPIEGDSHHHLIAP